jgi:RNA-directed DNA polymerase
VRIEHEILREARRQVARHETKGRLVSEENARRQHRSTGSPDLLRLKRPAQWAIDSGFNPYLVRSRASRVAHSIRSSLEHRQYEPRSPIAFDVDKAGGGTRQVCIYQVADSAVSKMLFEGVLKKNLPVLSARAYAYRKDLSAQNAIQFVKSELKGRHRVYVAEYDFRAYFDTIEHENVRRILNDRFLLTAVERAAIDGFLRVGPSLFDGYKAIGGPTRERGIPQGTSISLFLANVAAWELDRDLEGHGVGFARYADDTLIWATDYAKLTAAVDTLHAHAEAIGVQVNVEKSPGIRLLLPRESRGEFESTEYVDYLGHRIGLNGVQMKPSTEARIRNRVERLIYNTLLLEPMHGSQHSRRLPSHVDRDYVSVIARLRRYLYGDLSEKALRRYHQRGAPLRRFRGVMSTYPLLDDTASLAELDEWILDHLWLALRRRTLLLKDAGFSALPPPHHLSRNDLRAFSVKSARTGERIELSVPSVRLIASVIGDAAAQHGAAFVSSAGTYET